MIQVSDVLARTRCPTSIHRLPTPVYTGPGPQAGGEPHAAMFAVESMRRHTTDEGWQIAAGLHNAGYELVGNRLPVSITNVRAALGSLQAACAARGNTLTTVVMQDKREWDIRPGCFRDPLARFTDIEALAGRSDLFKLTILKDAQQRPGYHAASAQEIDCHAWIAYYHPRIVAHLAPFIRPEHLVRTYHSIDAYSVPPYTAQDRSGCLLSGAVSSAYPLRTRLVESVNQLPGTTLLRHPGYHASGCATPGFMQELSKYRVAICTASVYGYALRKLVEATAAGCAVITDLPVDEVMPEIDSNLHRIEPDARLPRIARLIATLHQEYNPERQRALSQAAISWYNYLSVGERLARDIERLRLTYANTR